MRILAASQFNASRPTHMHRFQHILTNLSLKDEDSGVLNWTGAVAQLAESGKITTLHSWNPVDIPTELKQRYPWLLEPGKEVSSERMQALVDAHLRAPSVTQAEQIIREGSPLGEALTIAESGEVDLVVCSRSEQDIYLSEKLARKAPCSVLSVPEGASPEFKRVLVPVDFSSHSNEALDVAIAFASAAGAELTLMHAFTIPWGEAKAKTARPEIVSEFKELHEARLRKLVSTLDLRGVEVSFHVTEAASAPEAINAAVSAGDHDLVVIGCRGRHAIYATLLGSTAEAILHGCPVPVVAVKSKSTARSVLAALRES